MLHKFILASLLTAGAVFAASESAQAFRFETNDFNTNPLSELDAKSDIFLESVKVLNSDGSIEEVITDFSYVTNTEIVYNDQYSGGNSGAASTDVGDNTTTGFAVEGASAEDITANLGNSNLNNIIDTEDGGSFQLDLFFDTLVDNLLIWERGSDSDALGAGNSDLALQALDMDGNLIGNLLTITRDQWFNAGFFIDTQEIGNAQEVGSLGVNIAQDLGIEDGAMAIRFFSEASFNGPDWKFVGTDAARQDVPEPTLILGLGLLGGLLAVQKRAQDLQAASVKSEG